MKGKQYEKAMEQFLQCSYDSKCQFFIASMHYQGLGVPQSYDEAFMWYRSVAKQGDASTQTLLGTAYWSGKEGVPQNYAEAVKWYRLAAEQGIALAQNNLGVAYERGLGTSQNYAEAVKWYRLAAEQGFAHAQYNLGMLYFNGVYFQKNHQAAYALLSSVALHGGTSNLNPADITRDRDLSRSGLTPTQMEQAQALADAIVEDPKNIRKLPQK